jgi:hypothetical protein
MSILNLDQVKDYELIDNYIYNNDWIVIRLEDNPKIEDIFTNNKIKNIVDCIQYRTIKHPCNLQNLNKYSKIYKFPKERIYDIIIIQMFNNMELVIDSNIIYKHVSNNITPAELILPITGNICMDISIIINSINIPLIYECNIVKNDLKKDLNSKKFYNKQQIYFDNVEKKVYSLDKQKIKKKSNLKRCLIM